MSKYEWKFFEVDKTRLKAYFFIIIFNQIKAYISISLLIHTKAYNFLATSQDLINLYEKIRILQLFHHNYN